MGLSLYTHYLAETLETDPELAEWFRRDLGLVNQMLVAKELPAHHEPSTYGTTKRRHVSDFPYSFLHYLRRAFALLHEDEPLTPLADGERPSEDPAVDNASAMMDSHLLCHSDAEGFYVPVDFDDILFDTEERGLPGGILGSSQGLMRELIKTAPALGIALDGGVLSDTEAARLYAEGEDESTPFWREKLVWLALYENARVSIDDKTLLVFA
ncbi:hypothetical protein [Mycobacterium decipiens]|uniref:Uncharacterized protein n=1 Tax=Mycobacterium decipiens TaxID=1430326 RepID=A0A1X2LXM2_9MYCO|nr:hypothetical protein [Mycobacterium decipiens]OSC41968.1 hypothetical protein B8W66_05350 [Mycobacterium decipiens]